jgi:hypothetical protein
MLRLRIVATPGYQKGRAEHKMYGSVNLAAGVPRTVRLAPWSHRLPTGLQLATTSPGSASAMLYSVRVPVAGINAEGVVHRAVLGPNHTDWSVTLDRFYLQQLNRISPTYSTHATHLVGELLARG